MVRSRIACLLVLAVLVAAGCDQLVGALPSMGAASSAATVSPAATAADPPKGSAAGTGSEGSSSGSSSGVGSHAIVCLDPATASGGGGPPCVPVAESAAVGAALQALAVEERGRISATDYVPGDAACKRVPKPAGCASGDPVGVVTFRLTDGGPLEVLVIRRPDGTLGSERLS
jgi:hypothetical protein